MKRIFCIFLIAIIPGLFGFRDSTINCVAEFTISGKMLNIEDMCENIPEGYDEMRIESIARNKTVYIRIMGTTRVIDSVTSDDYGNYSVTLPAGDYEFVSRWKTLPYAAPSNTSTQTWDTACHRLSYREPDVIFFLTEDVSDAEFVFYKYCPWNEPCCTYTGAKPNGDAPKNRGGYQPGHQE